MPAAARRRRRRRRRRRGLICERLDLETYPDEGRKVDKPAPPIWAEKRLKIPHARWRWSHLDMPAPPIRAPVSTYTYIHVLIYMPQGTARLD